MEEDEEDETDNPMAAHLTTVRAIGNAATDTDN